jgi:secreted PhoX family phosphatase
MKLDTMSRREFLEFMGAGAAAAALAGTGLTFLPACSGTSLRAGKLPRLEPSAQDALRLAPGLRHRIVAAYGDRLGAHGEVFGYNNDYLAFFPLHGSTTEGLLCVNHETPDPLFVSGFTGVGRKSRSQVEREMAVTGVSIVHIRARAPGDWVLVQDSKYNRLVNGLTRIPLVSERPIEGSREALGTLANCAGGVTPWGTYLTCEENYHLFYREVTFANGRRAYLDEEERYNWKVHFNWFEHYPQPPEHYGWVVEIEPRTGRAKKLTALGRFSHECATVRLAADGRPVVYSGDDKNYEHLYKFVAERPGSLERGTVYAADTVNGRWLALDWAKEPRLRAQFRDQTDVLVRAREAARLLGATPLDRPEDIEICPRTGAAYVALTNNPAAKNHFGSLLKVEEEGNDPLALRFRASTFLAGGPESGFACPDNLAFDAKGNLWMTTDISGSKMNKPPFTEFRNNGLFYIPMSGPHAGEAHLFATAPTDAEFTGPCFSPDRRTLFLSVQHPGEYSRSLDSLTSHWPGGGNSLPKPAVVAISGPLLDTLVGT